MFKLKNLVMFVLLTLTPSYLTAAAPSNPAMVPIISYLLSDSSFSFGDFAKGTKYFVNQNGSMGDRDYLENDTYTGVVNGVPVSGTYTYDENSMTLTRDDVNSTILVFTNPRPTVYGDGTTFDLSVNGSSTVETHNYDTIEARDVYIQAMSYSYEDLASNEYYGVDEDGSFNFVITYADLGNYDRNLTKNSFDQTNAIPQTFTIAENVITLGTGATITRIAIYADYSQILYDQDGLGTDHEPVLRRIYSDRTKAEAFYLSYSYEELASNEYYGVDEDGSFNFVITYADLGNYDRNLTKNSFDQTNAIPQTFTIAENVITLGTGATITRIAIYADYSQILYDQDGLGTDHEPVLRRIYSDRTKAEAFYDSFTVSFVNDVMPIFVDVDKGNCISCHTTTSNRTFKVGNAAYTYDNIITNSLIDTTSPDLSLILIKGNGGDAHNKGAELDLLTDVNSQIIRDWIAQGGRDN